MTAVILLSCGLYFWLGLAAYRQKRIWANPITFILLYYFANYPARAMLLVLFPEVFNGQGFESGDITLGLVYSSFYVLIFAGTYFLLLRTWRVSFEEGRLGDLKPDMLTFFVAATAFLISGGAVLGYEMSAGRSYSLGGDLEELRRPVWVNAFGVIYAIKWFVVCLGVLITIRTRSRVAALMTVCVVLMIFAEGLLSTGKGFLLTLFLAALFVDCLVTGRSFRLSTFTAAVVAIVAFSSYSYYSRYYLGAGASAGESFGAFTSYFSAADVGDNVADQMSVIVDRGTYYLDGLMLMMRDGLRVTPGPYAFGSAIDLLNIVPRALGLVEEQYSFDRHVTESVWGVWSFSQIFIGRIGESYFVLGELGILYAVLNGVIFGLVARFWVRAIGSISGIALYFSVLVSWLYQDASIFYQLKVLLYIIVSFYLITKLTSMFRRPAVVSLDPGRV